MDRLAHRLPDPPLARHAGEVVVRVARGWGRVIGAYSRAAITAEGLIMERAGLPDPPRIFVTWHGYSMIALRCHSLTQSAANHTFVPRGLRGWVMDGWNGAAGATTIMPPLDPRSPAPALKSMARCLREGGDASVAVDGPTGPARRVKPGAVWLARLSGCPLIAVGFAARPAFRWPRWDRQVVPLPGATVAISFADPFVVNRGEVLGDALLSRVAQSIDGATHDARRLLSAASSREARGGGAQ